MVSCGMSGKATRSTPAFAVSSPPGYAAWSFKAKPQVTRGRARSRLPGRRISATGNRYGTYRSSQRWLPKSNRTPRQMDRSDGCVIERQLFGLASTYTRRTSPESRVVVRKYGREEMAGAIRQPIRCRTRGRGRRPANTISRVPSGGRTGAMNVRA
jgi:hypothetical protein